MNNEPPVLLEQPLLRTKISVPQMPLEFVHRARLTERVNRGVMGPLTLLSAPAGTGKTNLLIEWTRQTNLPVAWLTLSPEDNDISRFFRYFIGALQTVAPDLGEDALDVARSTTGSGIEISLTLLINAVVSYHDQIVLVLDDFQTLENSIILQSINFFLKNQPPNFHLIVASRAEPALDMAFLYAKSRIVEVDVNDLRFTFEEVTEFFKQAMGLELPDETIQALEERTDGWITALQMAALSLQHQSDPNTLLENLQGEAHYLVDFLAEEVLDQLPEDIREFLLKSSILDALSSSLCEAVVKPDAQPGYGTVMLNRLEHAHLFITALDEKHEWFSYHNLFADFLRHIHAEINPAEIPELQKRAALWYEKNGNLELAIKYASASGNVEWTADLIERNMQNIIMAGEFVSLTHWINKIPYETVHKHPRLSLIFAWGCIGLFQFEKARFWIEDITATLDQIEKNASTAFSDDDQETIKVYETTGLEYIRGGLAICQSTLALFSGDADQAADFSRQAAGYLGEDTPFIKSLLGLEKSLYFVLSGDTQKAINSLRETIKISQRSNNLLVMIIATCQLADMQALQGQLSLAWATLQKVQYLAVDPNGRQLPLADLADGGLGEILLERNLLDEANAYLERGIEANDPLHWISNLDVMISLARLRQAQGDFDKAITLIENASAIALNTESSQWDDTIVNVIAVSLALRRENLSEAISIWKKSGFPNYFTAIKLENYPYHIYEFLLLTQARLLIAIGKSHGNDEYLHKSLDFLDSIQFEAEQFKRVTSLLEILVQQAVAQDALGNKEKAVNALRRALELGEPEGYRRIFLDGGEPVKDLLPLCLPDPNKPENIFPSREYISSLIASFPGSSDQSSSPSIFDKTKRSVKQREDANLTACLSERELEVLRLIAEGKSNQEISAQLFLALNTVKRHAYNIYIKLEVKKRTQAVSKARQLGLIS
jgi:LuxR family maltose regulon positive regulatory protein